jgi:hypothetical protein
LDGGVTSSHPQTPLHYAAWNGHVECIRVLIGEGANVEALNVRVGNERGGNGLDGKWYPSNGIELFGVITRIGIL